jgi:uncharacterized protein (TIGR00369 family)
MDKLQEAMTTLESALSSENVDALYSQQNVNFEFLNFKPDLQNEEARKRIFSLLMYSYNHKMPFNKLIGIEVVELSLDRAVTLINSKYELYGNFVQKIMHGGVISSVLDLAGGIIAQAHAFSKMKNITVGELLIKFSLMSTLNMRVDYLRPGAGDKFSCISRVVRAGNKVAVAQMELLNSDNKQVAIGTGSYLIG